MNSASTELGLTIDIQIPDTGGLKSLESLRWENIPDFVVLTGTNGSGKTQLLELIAHKVWGVNYCSLGDIRHAVVSIEGPVEFVADSVGYIPSRWDFNGAPSIDIPGVQNAKNQVWSQVTEQAEHDPRSSVLRARLERLLGVTNLRQLGQEAFTKQLPDDLSFLLDERDFTSGLGPVFLAHRLRVVEARERGLSEAEAQSSVGVAPWDLLNDAFAASGFQFRVTSPIGTKLLDPLQFRLKSTNSELTIWPADLSSGEKVILGLLVWLYRFNNHSGLPKLLLLDEPDAHLHPSMARQLIDVLNGVLVQRHHVRVILTTHSPSTVALAPEGSVFQMRSLYRDRSLPRITQTARDEAIGVLTAGLPTLRIHHQNRHQVFVESHYDADNYHALLEIVKPLMAPEISLSFLASGVAKSQDSGSCDRVKFFVDELTKNGVNTVYGIVDWDGHRGSTTTLLVLGDGERYTLENFIFDPLLVAAFLLRERILKPSELGLSEAATHMSILELSNETRQGLVDRILAVLEKKISGADKSKSQKRTMTTTSGITYELPIWFCEFDGHQLEAKLVECFPGLLRWKQPNALKAAFIDRVFHDLPQLVPVSLLRTFRAAQGKTLS